MSKQPVIVVVGETILDIDYELENAPAASPDGFPVHKVGQYATRKNVGGAAAVAAMIHGLGADVRFVTQCDPIYMGEPVGIKCGTGDWWWRGAVSEKRRFIHDAKVLFRLDTDMPVTRFPQHAIDAIRKECGGRPVYLVISDYGKGMCDVKWWMSGIRDALKPVESFADVHRSRESLVEANRLFGKCTVMTDGAKDPGWHCGLSEMVLEKHGEKGMELNGYSFGPRDVGMDPTTAIDTCGCGDMAIAALAVARSERQAWPCALKFAVAAAAEEALVWGAVPVSREIVDARLSRG